MCVVQGWQGVAANGQKQTHKLRTTKSPSWHALSQSGLDASCLWAWYICRPACTEKRTMLRNGRWNAWTIGIIYRMCCVSRGELPNCFRPHGFLNSILTLALTTSSRGFVMSIYVHSYSSKLFHNCTVASINLQLIEMIYRLPYRTHDLIMCTYSQSKRSLEIAIA